MITQANIHIINAFALMFKKYVNRFAFKFGKQFIYTSQYARGTDQGGKFVSNLQCTFGDKRFCSVSK